MAIQNTAPPRWLRSLVKGQLCIVIASLIFMLSSQQNVDTAALYLSLILISGLSLLLALILLVIQWAYWRECLCLALIPLAGLLVPSAIMAYWSLPIFSTTHLLGIAGLAIVGYAFVRLLESR